jgi:hypothetical protein
MEGVVQRHLNPPEYLQVQQPPVAVVFEDIPRPQITMLQHPPDHAGRQYSVTHDLGVPRRQE